MKTTQTLLAVGLITVLAVSASVSAAPIESVESSRASVAKQKLDAFLSEKIVVAQLTALGVKPEQVTARLAQLSDTQIEQLAAQIDLLKTGGDIQRGCPNPIGPLDGCPAHPVGCVLEQIRLWFKKFFNTFFCWGD